MRREDWKRLAAGLPPFTSAAVRDRAVRAVREVRRCRRLLYERLGSERLSRPALHGLDRRLEPYLPKTGRFVEAGANDGFQHSNTYVLERFRGWTGVLIEPVPELHRRCVRERPRSQVYNCALVPPDGPDTVTMRYRNLTSAPAPRGSPPSADTASWDREYDVTVPARTLSSVLEESGVERVDLLSLDVEGHELEALQGLDLDRHAPRLILVEPNESGAQIEAMLASRYQRLADMPPNDVLYRRR